MSTSTTITNSVMMINLNTNDSSMKDQIIDFFSGHNADLDGDNGAEYLSLPCRNAGYDSEIEYAVNRLWQDNLNKVQIENALASILDNLKSGDGSMQDSFLTMESTQNYLIVSFVCVIEC